MSLRKPLQRMTVSEYLEFEKASDIRHEYLDGEIYAMSGSSRRHNRISLNCAGDLRTRLRGSTCEVFAIDVKVHIDELRVFYYPDVIVTCDPDDRDDYLVTAPDLVVEVESPTTSAIDRREKLMSYRKLQSLREYLLLSQDSVVADLFRREDGGDWTHVQLEGDQELRLESVNITTRLSNLYDGVDLARN